MEVKRIKVSIPVWNIEAMNGYKPMTTFWSDFSIADHFGCNSIKDTYKQAKKEWKDNYKYWTELVLVLNHKIWQWYKTDNDKAQLYNQLWYDAHKATESWGKEELSYYYQVTD